MADIANNAGATSGNQRVGGVTVNMGNASISRNKAEVAVSSPSHDGDFHGDKLVSIASISGKYDNRFDDVGYY